MFVLVDWQIGPKSTKFYAYLKEEFFIFYFLFQQKFIVVLSTVKSQEHDEISLQTNSDDCYTLVVRQKYNTRPFYRILQEIGESE